LIEGGAQQKQKQLQDEVFETVSMYWGRRSSAVNITGRQSRAAAVMRSSGGHQGTVCDHPGGGGVKETCVECCAGATSVTN
jgi:hypothetical protein